jgi:uncharacterized protein (TIGR02391 family)
VSDLDRFEEIVRASALYTEAIPPPEVEADLHPFDVRDIHPDLPAKTRSLFDDGYYAEATFEAFKFVEAEVKRISKLKGPGSVGFALMMNAFDENNPKVEINARSTDTEIDEQRGFRHMFAGAQSGIRNPRGHEYGLSDTPDQCLDHLSLASLLLRRLDDAGVR